MAAQLFKIVGGGFLGRQALPAFFQVQQSHIYHCPFALPRHPYKHMLGVQAAVLPAPQMHAGQGMTDRFKHAVMYRFTVTLALTCGVPIVDLDKTFQAHRSPAMHAIACLALAAPRNTPVQAHPPPNGSRPATHPAPAKPSGDPAVTPAAVGMPDLSLDVEQAPIGVMYPLYTALTTATLVGLFNPFALLIPVELEWVVSRRGRLLYKINGHELSLS
jgi:hypothetical protein